MTYSCIARSCSKLSQKRISVLQMKILKFLIFKTFIAHTNPKFTDSNNLRFLFVLLMCMFVCVSLTYLCCNVFVSLVFCMWIILYSFIIISTISWFFQCLSIDLFIFDTTWICQYFFVKDLRLRYHWVE